MFSSPKFFNLFFICYEAIMSTLFLVAANDGFISLLIYRCVIQLPAILRKIYKILAFASINKLL